MYCTVLYCTVDLSVCVWNICYLFPIQRTKMINIFHLSMTSLSTQMKPRYCFLITWLFHFSQQLKWRIIENNSSLFIKKLGQSEVISQFQNTFSYCSKEECSEFDFLSYGEMVTVDDLLFYFPSNSGYCSHKYVKFTSRNFIKEFHPQSIFHMVVEVPRWTNAKMEVWL